MWEQLYYLLEQKKLEITQMPKRVEWINTALGVLHTQWKSNTDTLINSDNE